MLPSLSTVRMGTWPPARKLALMPVRVVRFGSARVRTTCLASSALIMALRLMPPPEMMLVMKDENELASAAGLLGPPPMVALKPPAEPPHWIPSSRPASRCASRMRTSRLTCWPPVRVMVLMTAGAPYWATMSSTFCMVAASPTVPESCTRPLTLRTFTLEFGTPALIEREMSAVSAPTWTAIRPTGTPSAENRLTVVVPNVLPTT